jgi:hypothetical protein
MRTRLARASAVLRTGAREEVAVEMPPAPPLSAAAAAHRLAGQSWQWEETYDSHDRAVYRPASDARREYFVLRADGGYVNDGDRGCFKAEGAWSVKSGPLRLRLTILSRDRRAATPQAVEYEIREISGDRLRLYRPDLDGFVVETYVVRSEQS